MDQEEHQTLLYPQEHWQFFSGQAKGQSPREIEEVAEHEVSNRFSSAGLFGSVDGKVLLETPSPAIGIENIAPG